MNAEAPTATFLPDTFSLSQGELIALQERTAHELGLSRTAFHDDAGACTGPLLVVIPAGTAETGAGSREIAPAHDHPRQVCKVERPFALGVTPVTAAEFDVYARATGWRPRSDLVWLEGDKPVINVRRSDAEAYCAWLSQHTGRHYRLPTETEWEYACRAGSPTAYPHGDRVSPREAHYNASGAFDAARPKRPKLMTRCFIRCGAQDVAQLPPSVWGLYDMIGNVWEFTASPWTPDRASPPETPRPNRSGALVVKGGSWFDGPEDCRPAARRRRLVTELDLNLGFRVLREL